MLIVFMDPNFCTIIIMLFNPTLDVFLSKNHATNKGKTVGRCQFDMHLTRVGLMVHWSLLGTHCGAIGRKKVCLEGQKRYKT